MKALSLIAFLLLGGAASERPTLSRLRKDLFEGYDKLVKPDEKVTVAISMAVIGLDLCQEKQQLTSELWMNLKWNDSRLAWDPEQYNGVATFDVPFTEVWMPDVTTLYGGKISPAAPDWLTFPAMIMSDGMVYFSPPTKIKTPCTVDFASGPFGPQQCQIKFTSWLHNSEAMDLVLGKGAIDTVEKRFFRPGQQFELIDVKVERTEPDYGLDYGYFPRIDVNLTMKRKSMVRKGKLVTEENYEEVMNSSSSEEDFEGQGSEEEGKEEEEGENEGEEEKGEEDQNGEREPQPQGVRRIRHGSVSALPPPYLGVDGFQNCMGRKRRQGANFKVVCLPRRKLASCEDRAYQELIEVFPDNWCS